MCISIHPLCWDVEPPTIFCGGGGLTGSQILEGACRERGGDIFYGRGCSFYIKKLLKSEIFNGKESS